MIREIRHNRILTKVLCAAAMLAVASASGAFCEDSNQTDGPSRTAEKNRSVFEHFHGHEPVYFLYGWDPDNIKFQISFKYRLLNPDGRLADKRPFLSDMYLGYTQTSFIDLDSPSDAFLDNSFQPEFLFSRESLMLRPTAWLSRLGLEAGIQHRSNGDSGADSRSFNMLYARPVLVFGDTGSHHLTVAPKVWAYVGSLRENPDIADFWGYFDLELKFGRTDGPQLRSAWRQGSEGGRLQIDLTAPLRALCFGSCNGYLQIQYFSGYGETLLNYNRKDRQLRIGFALFR